MVVLTVIGISMFFLFRNQNDNIPTRLFPTPTILPIQKVPTLIPEELPADLKNQSEADIKYGNALSTIYADYPWYEKLPLRSPNYFFYFDTKEKAFKALLYPKAGFSEETLKEQILKSMNEQNIPTTTYPIIWTVNPE